ncbi:hypothetical protein A3Q56_02030 [Intoshia linei]|uniref:Uncharacterized protein n=1 Tax=Intoshia linei TaxID=1819745 RepID=A0A177B9H7_9BILA|nr:hypothetical protein A3Q56_02030 [Intoshia linei]
MDAYDMLKLKNNLQENQKNVVKMVTNVSEWAESLNFDDEHAKALRNNNKIKIPSITCKIKEEKCKIIKKQKSKTTSTDYKKWDKYDADKVTSEMDEKCVNHYKLESDKYKESIKFKNMGNKLVKTGMFTDAVKCYSNAIELNTKDYISLANMALVYMKLEKDENALEYINKSICINPCYTKAFIRRSQIHYNLNNIESAIQDGKKVLKNENQNTDAFKVLDMCYKKLLTNKYKSEDNRFNNFLSQDETIYPITYRCHLEKKLYITQIKDLNE